MESENKQKINLYELLKQTETAKKFFLSKIQTQKDPREGLFIASVIGFLLRVSETDVGTHKNCIYTIKVANIDRSIDKMKDSKDENAQLHLKSSEVKQMDLSMDELLKYDQKTEDIKKEEKIDCLIIPTVEKHNLSQKKNEKDKRKYEYKTLKPTEKSRELKMGDELIFSITNGPFKLRLGSRVIVNGLRFEIDKTIKPPKTEDKKPKKIAPEEGYLQATDISPFDEPNSLIPQKYLDLMIEPPYKNKFDSDLKELSRIVMECYERKKIWEILSERKSKQIVVYIQPCNFLVSSGKGDNVATLPGIDQLLKHGKNWNFESNTNQRYPILKVHSFMEMKEIEDKEIDQQNNTTSEEKKKKIMITHMHGEIRELEFESEDVESISSQRPILNKSAIETKSTRVKIEQGTSKKYITMDGISNILFITEPKDFYKIMNINRPPMILTISNPIVATKKVFDDPETFYTEHHYTTISSYDSPLGLCYSYISNYGLLVSNQFAKTTLLRIIDDLDIIARNVNNPRLNKLFINTKQIQPDATIRSDLIEKDYKLSNPSNSFDYGIINAKETNRNTYDILETQSHCHETRILLGDKSYSDYKSYYETYSTPFLMGKSRLDIIKMSLRESLKDEKSVQEAMLWSEIFIICITMMIIDTESDQISQKDFVKKYEIYYNEMINDKYYNFYGEKANFNLSAIRLDYRELGSMTFVPFLLKTLNPVIKQFKTNKRKEVEELKPSEEQTETQNDSQFEQQKEETNYPTKRTKKHK